MAVIGINSSINFNEKCLEKREIVNAIFSNELDAVEKCANKNFKKLNSLKNNINDELFRVTDIINALIKKFKIIMVQVKEVLAKILEVNKQANGRVLSWQQILRSAKQVSKP